MNTKLTIAALTALLMGTVSAQAGVSCYVGAAAGYSIANTDASLDEVGGPAGIIAIDGLSAEGGSGGFTTGCDYRMNRFILGAWGDYTWHGADFEVAVLGTPIAEMSLDRQWSVGGRAGAFVSDSTLVYGLVGFTRASASDIAGPGYSLAVEDMDGIVYGGGLEVDVGNGFMIGAEYRYTDLEDQNVPEGSPLYLNLDPGIHTARAVLKYRFDFK